MKLFGARGMNLGIEDAWTFAQLLKEGELWRYDALRHKIDQRVARRIELLSRLARGESSVAFNHGHRVAAGRHVFEQNLAGISH